MNAANNFHDPITLREVAKITKAGYTVSPENMRVIVIGNQIKEAAQTLAEAVASAGIATTEFAEAAHRFESQYKSQTRDNYDTKRRSKRTD